MDGAAVEPTAEGLVSAVNSSVYNSSQLDGDAQVDEFAKQIVQQFQYVNLAVRVVMGLLAFSTNLLTVVAIASFESMRSATNYMIAFLAFADMLAGFNTILLVTNYLAPMSNWLWTRMCALETTLHFFAAGVNVRAILGISIERLIYITFPLRYYTWPTERAAGIFIVAGVLMVAGQMSQLNCCGYKYLPRRVCTGKVFKAYNYSNSFFLVVSGIIMIVNIMIGIIAYRQKRATARGQVSAVSADQNKITKMMAMVLGVFYGCYMPQMGVLLILGVYFPGPRTTAGIIIERISSWFWWVNSWSNPLIYAWKNKEFNKSFRILLGMKSATVNPALD